MVFFSGFKGNARVIVPGLTACVECTLDLYPPQVSVKIIFVKHFSGVSWFLETIQGCH